MIKKGIYIHIPFCKKKCAYCSFNSFDNIFSLEDDYTNAVIKHILSLPSDEIDTIYFGGGTPSAINEKNITKILNTVYDKFKICDDAEITIEINPGTVTKEKLLEYKKSKINRISIGSQDFFDKSLKILGRIHSVDDIYNTVKLAKECGFSNFNLDLMYGFDNQTLDMLKASLDKIISLSPTHISTYALSIEEDTPLFNQVKNGKFVCATDEIYAKMYETISDFLVENGYEKYEMSNFCKDGFLSKHNTKYWKCGNYYGVGAGASGYIANERYTCQFDVKKYIENPLEKINCENLTNSDKMSEFVILGLRLIKGISKKEFFDKFGVDIFDVFENSLNKHIKKTKLIIENNDKLYLSQKAHFISNAVFVDFI